MSLDTSESQPFKLPKSYGQGDIAGYFGVTISMVNQWLKAGKLPRPDIQTPGGRKRWSEELVQQILAAAKQGGVK